VRSAAVISYFALLSFVPLVIVTLSILGFVLAATGGDLSESRFLDPLLDGAEAVVPYIRDTLKDKLRSVVLSRGSSGLVGGLALMFSSSLVFGSLEAGLARIFDHARPRHMVLSKLLFLGFVGGLGLYLLVSSYVMSLVNYIIVAQGGESLYSYIYSSVIFVMLQSYISSVLVFIVLMRVFTTVRFEWKWLFCGGTVFYLLWKVSGVVFDIYVKNISRLSLVYGSISALVVLMLWVFYASVIFLYCAALVRQLQGIQVLVSSDVEPVTKRIRRALLR
jgi:membrane protein